MLAFPQVRSLFEDMEAFNRKISDRAFAFFQQRGGTNGWDADDWFRAESEVLKQVPIEISESRDNYMLRAEVPGFEAKEIEVQAESNAIYIHGKSGKEKEVKEGKEVRYSEVSANEFCRRVELPSLIAPEKVAAHLANGILQLTLPKAAPPKSIEVKAV
jgi:HSP20 family protein